MNWFMKIGYVHKNKSLRGVKEGGHFISGLTTETFWNMFIDSEE